MEVPNWPKMDKSRRSEVMEERERIFRQLTVGMKTKRELHDKYPTLYNHAKQNAPHLFRIITHQVGRTEHYYTRERCIDCIRQCKSGHELQQRFFGAYRNITNRYPDLKELYPWKRKDRLSPEEKKRREEEKAQRKAEREQRAAERNAEQQERSRRYQERLAEQAIIRKQREEEKAQRRAEREAEAAERERLKEEQRKHTIEANRLKKIAAQRAFLDEGKPIIAKTTKWTEQTVREALLECGSTKELRKRYRRAFNLLYERYRHLLELVPQHICSGYLAEHKQEWTMDRCREMARQYASVKEEREQNPALYHFIARNGWLRYCHQDITGKKVSEPEVGIYARTRGLIKEYSDGETFQREHPLEYHYAMSTKTLRSEMNKFLRHIEPRKRRMHNGVALRVWQNSQWGYRRMKEGGDITRVIYACEFPDHCAYVGLTADPAKRCREHGWISNVGNSAVAEHKWTTNQDFEFKILTDFLPEEEASVAEGEWERKYAEEGWTMLNVAPTGSLGGSGVRGISYWENMEK